MGHPEGCWCSVDFRAFNALERGRGVQAYTHFMEVVFVMIHRLECLLWGFFPVLDLVDDLLCFKCVTLRGTSGSGSGGWFRS